MMEMRKPEPVRFALCLPALLAPSLAFAGAAIEIPKIKSNLGGQTAAVGASMGAPTLSMPAAPGPLTGSAIPIVPSVPSLGGAVVPQGVSAADPGQAQSAAQGARVPAAGPDTAASASSHAPISGPTKAGGVLRGQDRPGSSQDSPGSKDEAGGGFAEAPRIEGMQAELDHVAEQGKQMREAESSGDLTAGSAAAGLQMGEGRRPGSAQSVEISAGRARPQAMAGLAAARQTERERMADWRNLNELFFNLLRGDGPGGQPGLPDKDWDRAYTELPPQLRAWGESFYRQVEKLSGPQRIALMDDLKSSDLQTMSDHSFTHMRDIVLRYPRVLAALMESGMMPSRAAARVRFMDYLGRSLTVAHDIGMREENPQARKEHPAFAAREVFGENFDAMAEEWLSSKAGGNSTVAEALVRDYGIAPENLPRMARELLSMSYLHSKSQVPLTLLNDPKALRKHMQGVLASAPQEKDAQRAGDYLRFYGPGRYAEQAYDWLDAPLSSQLGRLARDVVDSTRALRLADAMRARGQNFRHSSGGTMGVAVLGDKVDVVVRLMDPESGRTYLFLMDKPLSAGEANTRRTAIAGPADALRGSLIFGIEKGYTGAKALPMAEATAMTFLDVYGDYFASFGQAAGKRIILESPVRGDPAFAEAVRDAILRQAREMASQDSRKNGAMAASLEKGGFEIRAPAHREAPAAAQGKVERERYERARQAGGSFNSENAEAVAALRGLVEAGGADTARIAGGDFKRALEGAVELQLAPGENLVELGGIGEFVYLPLEGAKMTAILPLGYEGGRLRAGVPLGELSVVTGDPRRAAIRVDERTRVLAIPRQAYLEHWTQGFYTPRSLIARLRADLGPTAK